MNIESASFAVESVCQLAVRIRASYMVSAFLLPSCRRTLGSSSFQRSVFPWRLLCVDLEPMVITFSVGLRGFYQFPLLYLLVSMHHN